MAREIIYQIVILQRAPKNCCVVSSGHKWKCYLLCLHTVKVALMVWRYEEQTHFTHREIIGVLNLNPFFSVDELIFLLIFNGIYTFLVNLNPKLHKKYSFPPILLYSQRRAHKLWYLEGKKFIIVILFQDSVEKVVTTYSLFHNMCKYIWFNKGS